MKDMKKATREKIVVRTSLISIVANILLAGFKALVGTAANSIAIISDAINNLSDALSSIITIVGTKLAGRAPDRDHPYGHGRIEYMTAFIVSAVVLYAGLTAMAESVKKIIQPENAEYDTLSLAVMSAAIVVKFLLGLYVKKKGHVVNSSSLVASGQDAFNDALLSISVLTSAIIYLIWQVSLEAYVGILVAIVIIKSGIELIKKSADDILESRASSDLTKAIKHEVAKEPSVQGAFDLVLNNYGPDAYLGSIHIELADTMPVAEVDAISRRISKRVAEKYGVILHTIGVYSVNTKDKTAIKMHERIEELILAHDGVLQMHGFYVDFATKSLSFDIILDFAVPDREALYRQICKEIRQEYPDFKVDITLDVDVSD